MNRNTIKYHIRMIKFHLDFAKKWMFLVEVDPICVPSLENDSREMFFNEAKENIKKARYNLLIIETMEYNCHE